MTAFKIMGIFLCTWLFLLFLFLSHAYWKHGPGASVALKAAAATCICTEVGVCEACTTHLTLYYSPPEHTQSLLNYLQAIHLCWQTCSNCAPFLRPTSDGWFQNHLKSHPKEGGKKGLGHKTTFISPLFIDTFDHLLSKAAWITGNTSLAGNQIHFLPSLERRTVLRDTYI